MEDSFDKYYPYKVWVTSAALVPILLFLRLAFMHNDYDDLITKIRLAFAVSIVGSVISLPTFVLYYLSFKAFSKINFKPIITKVILCLIALAGILLTFRILGNADTDLGYNASKLYFIFALSIFLPGLVFKISKRNKSTGC